MKALKKLSLPKKVSTFTLEKIRMELSKGVSFFIICVIVRWIIFSYSAIRVIYIKVVLRLNCGLNVKKDILESHFYNTWIYMVVYRKGFCLNGCIRENKAIHI